MIFVMLGTQNNSFHRLLEEIDKLIEKKVIKEKVVAQIGYTKYEGKNIEVFDLLPKEELEKYQKEASLIITHGGAGSIISSLKFGKKVIAIPRKHEYGEHVNNHQEEIVTMYNEKGYIIGIDDVTEWENAIKKAKNFKPKEYKPNNQKMLKIIENFIESIWNKMEEKWKKKEL